jgi:hypothetical protein
MPAELTGRARAPNRAARFLVIASGAVPLLALCGAPADPMLLIYSFFVAAWVLRGRSRDGPRLPGPAWLGYLVLMVLVGFLTETLAWLGNYLARAEQPAMLHPQLVYDLLLSPGIYAAWAVGWIVATRRWRFSLTQLFFVQGVYGVFLEQQGAVFLEGLEAMPLGLVLWLYVFVVYGSAAGLAYLPFERHLSPPHAHDSLWKFPAALLLQFLATAVIAIAWGLLLTALGLVIPEPRPIWQAPFW